MQFKTHILFGFLVGIFFLKLIQIDNMVLYFVLIILGSLLPDIDHPNSKIGSLFKPVGWLFEHRGFFHSIFPVIILLLLIKVNQVLFIPLSIGYISHILIDMVTIKGVLLIYPLINLRVNGFIKTGGLIELIIFYFLVIVNLFLIIKI